FIKITGIHCQVVDPLFLKFENCVIKPVNRDVKELNMVIRVFQLPVNNVTIEAEIFRRGYSSQSLFQTVVDGCKFLSNKRRNPVAIAIYKFFRMDTTTNMNHSCPFNHDLIVDHLRFDKDLNLRLPIGKGDYSLKLNWKILNVLRTIVIVNMQITD
ncbi:hypothetical protein KR044_004111, partial [Drosophila immigrans]